VTTSALLGAVLLLALVDCGPGPEPPGGGQLPPDLHSACALTTRRCTHCHTLDRVLTAHVGSPLGWRPFVERMRRMPASGIPPAEAPTLVRCLVFWSFGEPGLAVLDNDGDAP
jgi:hypothetical protein